MITRRQFLRGCVHTLLAFSGTSFALENVSFAQLSGYIPVVLYHRVGPETDNLTVTPEHFDNDLACLQAEGYTALTLKQARTFPFHEDAETIKPVLITFDDGYLDNYEIAFPILQKYNMPATFFIITGMIGQKDRLSWPNLHEMAKHGMSFGSHTVTHRSLDQLSDAELAVELNQSKETLEQGLGRSVSFIAYPCGKYNTVTTAAVQSAGYRGGFTTHSGLTAVARPDFELNRIPVFRHDRPLPRIILRKGWMPKALQ